MNFSALIVAAISALVIGSIWYHPAVFGKIWMRSSGMTEEKIKQGNMFVIMGLAFIFSFFIAFILQFLVIHQTGAFALMGADEAAALPSYKAFMDDYGSAFRTYKHGALHGSMAGILFAFPIIAIPSLFEQKPWSNILVNSGYWVLSLTVMGAIICGWV